MAELAPPEQPVKLETLETLVQQEERVPLAQPVKQEFRVAQVPKAYLV